MSQEGLLVLPDSPAPNVETLTGDTGGAVAPDGLFNIDILGGTSVSVDGNPGASSLTINLDGTVSTSFPADSGTAVPAAGALTVAGGTGISTSGSGSTLTIVNTAPAALTWNLITTPTQNLVASNGYIANNAGGVVFTLPLTAVVGNTFRVTGIQASWEIAQNASQTIHYGNQSTTVGITGKINSTQPRDSVLFICVVANTDFQVLDAGNVSIT